VTRRRHIDPDRILSAAPGNPWQPTEEEHMGTDDKIANKGDSTLGKAKEKLGDATDNRDLEAEGKKDQSKADLKQAGEKVKDAFKH
jgi:uncharacterized protein YjbJ (UPF0337 family)